MATLHVALQDGFVDDEVVVEAGEQVVYRKEAVTTRTQIGLADTFEIEIGSQSTMLRVSLPGRGLTAEHTVLTTSEHYVAISVADRGVEIKESEERFRYA